MEKTSTQGTASHAAPVQDRAAPDTEVAPPSEHVVAKLRHTLHSPACDAIHGKKGHRARVVAASNFQGEPPHALSHATLVARSNAHRSFCKACTLAKLDSRPSFAKDSKVLLPFLQRIQGDICGPIQPECGPFKYFMVLVDASTRWSHVSLLSTRNAAFSKLLE